MSKIPKKLTIIKIFLFFMVLFLLQFLFISYKEREDFGRKYSFDKESFDDNDTGTIFALLDDLDVTIRKHSSENKIYGNIYSAKGRHQVLSYMKAVKSFARFHQIRTICEIGFAGGHSASVFLFLTKSARYTAFDIWDKQGYEDAALTWVKNKFQNREIIIIKGDSTKTVPQYQGKCDLIHIDGAHHAHFPLADMKNMERIASKDNLLLMDDCSKSWPAVLKGVHFLKENYLVRDLDMVEDENWVFRGSVKGWCIGSYKKTENNVQTERNYQTLPNNFTFLGKTFCGPSWAGNNCDTFIKKQCSPLSDECFYNEEYGTLSVSCKRWHDAQLVEKMTWDTRNTKTDRNEAHAISFDHFKTLPNTLGDVIELGAGPFTQSQTIMKNKKARSITLIEPMAFHYINGVKHCYYKNGEFNNLPTTLLSIPAEELNKTRKFDTLVMINVIEHVYDGLSILSSAINLLKDNGILIWHERIWDTYRGKANSPEDREFKLHPIRIKTIIVKQVISLFQELYVSWKTEELQRLKNQGVYFIGRKRRSDVNTFIPKHPPCFERPYGIQDIIFFVSNLNYTLVANQLQIAIKSLNVKSVIMVLTEAMEPMAMSKLLKYKEIKIIVSRQHLGEWKEEIGFYTTPCKSITPRLTQEFLTGVETLCIGNDDSMQVTVILMGHSTKRLKNYDLILPDYLEMKLVKTIIIVWNNKEAPFPSKFNHTKMILVYPEVNNMNNRFNVSSLVITDAVLVIDDDVLMSKSLLYSMLLQWNENVNRLIGVEPDMRYVSEDNKYMVQGHDAVIALGKTMLFHRKYLEQYMNDEKLVKWNKNKFCEDISMNALITKATSLKPFFIKQTATRNRRNLPETDGLSIIRTGWTSLRTECVRFVSKHFQIHF